MTLLSCFTVCRLCRRDAICCHEASYKGSSTQGGRQGSSTSAFPTGECACTKFADQSVLQNESVPSLVSMLIPTATLLQWKPTREGYLRFLVESELVYDALEQIVQQASVPECESSMSSKLFKHCMRQRHFTLHCAAWTC